MELPEFILGEANEGSIVKLIVFGIAIAIWLIGVIAKSISGATKKPDQQASAPDWGDGQIVIRPEDYQQAPPPIPLPPPMPPRQQSRKPKQKQKQPKATPMPELVLPVDESAPAPAKRQAARTGTASANTVAGNVRMLLQPGSVREAYVLSQILGKPKGME